MEKSLPLTQRFSKIPPLASVLLPYLLCITLDAAIFNVYIKSALNLYSVLSVLLTAGFFFLFKLIRSKKYGFLIFGALGIAVLMSEYMIMSSSTNKIGYVEWFLSGGIAVQNTTEYLLATLVGFSFFISAAVFYFTQVIYRSSVIMLISLIPCAIYIKAAASAAGWLIAVIAALNLFIFIMMGRNEVAKKAVTVGKGASITAYVDFAVAAVLLALILPKPNVTPYYEKFENFVSRYNIGGSSSQNMGEFTKYSGNADEMLQQENVLLYIVNTEKPCYYRIQTFDIYDAVNHRWTYTEGLSSKGFKGWQDNSGNMSLTALAEEYAAELPIAEKLPDLTEDSVYSAIVKAVDFPSRYVIVPARITDVSLFGSDAVDSFRTPSGEIFTDSKYLGATASYTLSYYATDFARTSGWIESGLCDLSFEDFGRVLSSISLGNGYNTAANAFYDEYLVAEEYAPENYDAVSAEITKLSQEITGGLEFDYQKAAAIEQYFQNGGFTYDLAFRPPADNDTPEYFLFQSKTGTCSDFATAYCLLARAAGLHVRYCEGFTTKATGAEMVYQIFTENAHAYPQVYIPGAGWVEYEPTVAATAVERTGAGNENAQTDYLAVFLTCIVAAVSIAVIAAFIIAAPFIAEGFFRLRITHSDGTRGIISLYNRFSERSGKLMRRDVSSLTAEQLAAEVFSRTALSADELVKPFILCCYGGGKCGRSQVEAALSCYKIQLKALRAYNKTHKRKG